MPEVRGSQGVRLYAEVHGDGPAVIFSCGFNTTRETFRPQVAPLVAAGFRVVLWDYRGHGRSETPAEPEAYSMEHVLGDLQAVHTWAAPDEAVVLAGFSFGGVLSLHTALRHPERVRALVLLDTGPGFKNPDARKRWIAQTEKAAERLEARGFEGFLASRAADFSVGRRRDTPAAQAAAAALREQDPRAVAWFGRRVAGPVPGLLDALASIDVPALVLVGEEDEPYRRAAEVMAARLPRARAVVVPGAGHVATLEEPERVNRHLLEFLEGLPPA